MTINVHESTQYQGLIEVAGNPQNTGIFVSSGVEPDSYDGLITGNYTSVTNLLIAGSKDMTNASWGQTSSNLRLTSNKLIFNSTANILQFGRNDVTIIKNNEYIVIADITTLNCKPIDYNGAYMQLVIAMHDSAVYMSGQDYQQGGMAGERIPLLPGRNQYSARFIARENIATGQVLFRDQNESGDATILLNMHGVYVYDITGLSGVIYDATNNVSRSLEPINLIGDSMPKLLERVRYFLNRGKLNVNGQFYKTGDLTSGSAIIANISTTNLQTGMYAVGVGIPVGATITVSGSTVTLSGNATASTTGLNIRFGLDGGSKTSTQILANFNASKLIDSTLAASNSIVWMGHNDPTNGITLAQSKANMLSLTDQLTNDYRVLTLSYNTTYTNPRTSSADFFDQFNDWLLSQYGSKCIDVRPALNKAAKQNYADTFNLSWGRAPASCLTDSIHLTYLGVDMICDAIKQSVGNSWR